MRVLTPKRQPKSFAYLLTVLGYLIAWSASAQTGSIQGHISSATGQPATGVSVGMKGTTIGSNTDADGNYQLSQLKPGTYTLGVSMIGFKTQQRRIEVKANETATQNFTLEQSTEQLNEVVVEGSQTNKFARKQSEYVGKMQLSNLENPQVYATVGKELLAEQLVFSVDDATRNVPGLQRMWSATGRAGDGGSYYNSRGFYFQSQLRNGVAGNVTSTIDAVNLEKLEMIKGPSATLFGSALTSYGGLINRVTKKAYDHFGGEVTYSAGSFAFNRLSLDINTPLTQDGKLLFRLNAAGTYEDSWQNRGYTGFNKSLAIAPTLTYKPTDRLTINLDAEIFRGRGVMEQLIFPSASAAELGTSRANELPLDYRQSYIGKGLIQSSHSTNYLGQVNYQIAPGLTSSTNFTHSRSYSDGAGPYVQLFADSIALADQSTSNSRSNLTEVQQLFNGDFKLGSLRNRVVLGLDYLHINNNQNFFGYFSGPRIPLGLGDRAYTGFNGTTLGARYASGPPDSTYPVTTKINTYSAFISDVLNLTESLSVLAALRIDRYDNQGSAVDNPTDAYKQTTLSPKFGVVFQPVLNRVSLFANYQNSFNNRGTYIDTNGSIRNATAERANQIEGGVKLDAADGRLNATISYYDIRVTDILRTTPTTIAQNAQTQDGTQFSKGVELNVVANPIIGFNVVAGFAYNDSKLKRTSDLTVVNRRPSTAAAPYLANLWLSYRLTTGAAKGLGLGAGGNYASDNRIQNTTTNVIILPNYTVLNASLFYDQLKYRISMKVDNLTNEHYWIGYGSINPQKVRSIVGSVSYKF